MIPIIGGVLALRTPLRRETVGFSIFYYFCTGCGITAGYHRLWSHRSYNASRPLKIYLANIGAAAGEGSIKWWAKDHRAHHRYTDTDKDPYSVNKGLLYAHIGWLLQKQNPAKIGRVDVFDLKGDLIVRWQDRYYLPLFLFGAFGLQTIISGMGWGDWHGGFVYAGTLRMLSVQQATFCVNSIAHWLGDQPYEGRNTPRDHFFTSLVAIGEGYHIFHHQFPSDYRTGIKWYHYDPAKWLISAWCHLGLASELKRFPEKAIQKCQLLQLQQNLNEKRSAFDWGLPISELPVIEWDEYIQAQTRLLVVIAGVVYDVTEFINNHPGGRTLLSSAIGKDATAMFHGGVYDHSRAARCLLAQMRIAVIRGGGEVVAWEFKEKDSPN